MGKPQKMMVGVDFLSHFQDIENSHVFI